MVESDNSTATFFETSNLNRVLADEEEVQKAVYRMQESRRMRSRKLHYLDHPKIGALIQIVPVEIPQKDIDPQKDIKKSSKPSYSVYSTIILSSNALTFSIPARRFSSIIAMVISSSLFPAAQLATTAIDA